MSLPEPPYQAAKWIKIPVLLEPEEMEELFQALSPFLMYLTSTVLPRDSKDISHEKFLSVYRSYISALKGEIPYEAQTYTPYLSSVLTVDSNAIYRFPVSQDKELIRIRKPLIQMQEHTFDYSSIDHEFRSMVRGLESLRWGIQFSYPQVYDDPNTREVLNVLTCGQFPNTILFKTLQKWIRTHTLPTPFIVEGKRINVPIRLGKKCFSWIKNHPDLIRKGLQVDEY